MLLRGDENANGVWASLGSIFQALGLPFDRLVVMTRPRNERERGGALRFRFFYFLFCFIYPRAGSQIQTDTHSL